ncbi:BON domain-containing protein [Singulisphaera acidiphila]|uniref:Putative periplasmic or secreted lipoprotein n=1 Tax=Singulisphaera acidiphila (strain ATCC BAA-1392 / DSM 18658 / VKM B-2454 / MOB10) TaxID=886293 RepID=L0DEZ7_SINAD|nr:BON domain-containing protein [Singulisphaera acidiphila]AGA27256.1 putative periplasmic or secreted lipoprotein [Singulisphaera acidiphila DSM 18658]
MMQPWTRCSLVSICGVACLGLIPPALAVDPPKANPVDVNRPEVAVFQMLRSHPVTAPYPIATTWRAGQVVLSGRVGTKVVHDTAIRLAIASGHSVRDDLTIDTAAVYRTAGTSVVMNPPGAFPLGGAPYYVYPPPLFGRIDDPFYGFEPPLVSYPPWWPAVAAREPINLPAQAQGNLGQPDPGVGADPNAASPIKVPIGASADDGFVEMTIDPRGAAVLRGTVSTAADRVAIGQKIAQIPGINQVENLLNVGAAPSDTPPPPPEPAVPAPPPAPKAPAKPEAAPIDPALQPTISADKDDLSQRVGRALVGRPALAKLPIKVSVREGVAYLSGEVPTVYEAMLAFRAAQQTPGVRQIDDRLQFVVPDGERRNPLQEKGRPDDVEPYLTAQIRRQVGDIAHVDQVRLQGNTLEIKGSLLQHDDKARLDAILRSMPVLRGFRLEPSFVVE